MHRRSQPQAVTALIALVLSTTAWTVGCSPGASGPPRAEVDGEILEGVFFGEPDEAVFKGIPFAAPPVGDLRWRPPAAHVPRGGVQSVTAFGPACPQTDRLAEYYRRIATAFGQGEEAVSRIGETSEDCLYLNVWTGNWGGGGGEPQPVMVWIHGGSNNSGSGSEGGYDGARLSARGVVVVTINYRLGALGFLAHPALTAESPHGSSGNYALLDQIEALRWVQRNIAAFGGDPNRVTVFGESAGSMDVMHLMASPLATGLFHRAIGQSGAPLAGAATLKQGEARGERLAKWLGVEGDVDVTGALRMKDADEIVRADADVPSPSGSSIWTSAATVIVDGWVLPEPTGRVFATGAQQAVPLLVGSTADEFASLRYYLPSIERSVDAYQSWVSQTFGLLASWLIDLYPATADEEVDQTLISLMTDLTFTCLSRFAASTMPAAGTKAYLYHFTRALPGPGGEKLGAFHGFDIGYVFDTRADWFPLEQKDRVLTDAMAGYWTEFAATGDPNRKGSPEWPAYTAETDLHLELGSEIRVAAGLKKRQCDAVDGAFAVLRGGGGG